MVSRVVDVSDEDAVTAGMQAVVDEFGGLDSCFANAGVGPHPTSIDTMTTQEWRRVMAVNLDGVFFTVRAATGQMKALGAGGSIVVTSSVSISHGMAYSTHYAAAKSALVAKASAGRRTGPRRDPGQRAGAGLDEGHDDRSPTRFSGRQAQAPDTDSVAVLRNSG